MYYEGNGRDKILESLQVHLDFLDVAAKRHEKWADRVSDPNTQNLHLEIRELIIQTREKYQTLFEWYSNHSQ